MGGAFTAPGCEARDKCHRTSSLAEISFRLAFHRGYSTTTPAKHISSAPRDHEDDGILGEIGKRRRASRTLHPSSDVVINADQRMLYCMQLLMRRLQLG